MKASGDGTNDTGVVHYKGRDKAFCFCDAVSVQANLSRNHGTKETWVLYGDFSLGEVC